MAGPLLALVVIGAVIFAIAPGKDAAGHPGIASDARRVCGYGRNTLGGLREFQRLVDRPLSCALVFVDSPDWRGWERPYFLAPTNPGIAWAKWVRDGGGKRDLIVTQTLFPGPMPGPASLKAAAAGQYDSHARAFARALVDAGLSHAVIRLAHEANFRNSSDDLPPDRAGMRTWARAWRREVLAMKSVDGAHFRFDLTLNAAVAPIPLERFWPGDDVVDFVGIDAYDAGIRQPRDRWKVVYERPLGVRDVLRFARAHGKALTIPEWGVGPAGDPTILAGGDDPGYVDGLAGVVRDNRVAYQVYFFNHQWATELPRAPKSLRAYKRHFGVGGDAAGVDN